MIKCSYGCGNKAHFFFNNGKGCCLPSPNSCEGKRKKDSEKKKGSFKGTPFWSISGNTKQFIPWNKGKKGIYSEEYRNKISNSLKNVSKGVSSTKEGEEERRKKISDSMKKNPLSGGLRKGSGRGKKGWYKGYWCDSTWELAWVIYQIEHQVLFKRNKEGFEYFFQNKKNKYYPDFVIDDNYYEIKGRRCFENLDDRNKSKILQFNKKLIVLYEKDMKIFIDYVIDKYGQDYYRLYE
jgi:hypothetical protein